jgi:aspartyl-tRNA(Asn)/glutamyl-tRNA(Gln) amidotransferase subunit C
LEPGEIDVLQRQLEQILGYVEELRSVDVEGVEPMAHPLARENVLRADEPVSGLDHETAMELAPEVRDGQFSVPSILE